MGLISEKDREKLTAAFNGMARRVDVFFFADEADTEASTRAREIIEEVAALSPRIMLKPGTMNADREAAARFGVRRGPAFIFCADGRPCGISIAGVPEGYELLTLLNVINIVGSGETELGDDDRRDLAAIKRPVALTVFVAPDCPNCAMQVLAACSVALAAEKVDLAVIEATRFPELIARHAITEVPKTMVGEYADFIGKRNAAELVGWVLEAAEAD